jgi:hypothetical protein
MSSNSHGVRASYSASRRHQSISMLSAAISVAAISVAAATAVEAKVPGRSYCFNGTCHYVKTIAETERMVGKTVVVKTSFYRDAKVDRFNPSNITSSGEYFRKPDLSEWHEIAGLAPRFEKVGAGSNQQFRPLLG